MRTTGVLGASALVAIIVAAICFAVVDASTTGAQWCTDQSATCSEPPFAGYTAWFAVAGAIALVACIVPAILWLSRVLRPAAAADDELPLDVTGE